jgi:RibD C-terminal domain
MARCRASGRRLLAHASAAVHKGVRIVNDDPRDLVRALKEKPGRDIWLFGGGSLFRSLLDAGLVDTVEVGVMPVLLGSGIPRLPPGASTRLELRTQNPASGIVMLSYAVPGGVGPAPRLRYIKPPKQGKTPTIMSSTRRPYRPRRRAAPARRPRGDDDEERRDGVDSPH